MKQISLVFILTLLCFWIILVDSLPDNLSRHPNRSLNKRDDQIQLEFSYDSSNQVYAKCGFGTPPQYFKCLIDTGCALSWIRKGTDSQSGIHGDLSSTFSCNGSVVVSKIGESAKALRVCTDEVVVVADNTEIKTKLTFGKDYGAGSSEYDGVICLGSSHSEIADTQSFLEVITVGNAGNLQPVVYTIPPMNAKAGKLVVGLKSGMQIPREMTLEPVIYNYGTWETILTYFGPALENLLNRNACSLYQTGTLSVDGLPQLQNCVRRKKYTAVFDISAKKHKFPADIFEIVTSYDGIQCNEDGSCQIHTDNVGKLPELFVKLQKLEFRLAPQDYVSCPLDQYQQKRHEMCEVMISSFPSADCGSENGSESDVLLFGSSLLKSHQILMNNDPCEISNQSDQFYAMYNCNNSAISNLHRRGLFNSWNWFRCSAIAIYCIDCNWSYGWKWVGWT